MDNINITWQTLLAIAGGVGVLFSAGKAIAGLFGPLRRLSDKVEAHEKKLINDHARLCRLEEDSKMMLMCLLTLLQHEQTGNDTGLMDKTIKDLHAYLAGRK